MEEHERLIIRGGMIPFLSLEAWGMFGCHNDQGVLLMFGCFEPWIPLS